MVAALFFLATLYRIQRSNKDIQNEHIASLNKSLCEFYFQIFLCTLLIRILRDSKLGKNIIKLN